MSDPYRKSLVVLIILFFMAVSIVPTTGRPVINYKLIRHENREESSNGLYFDLKIRSLMILGHFPSLSVCIIKNDTVVWSNGYGWARPGKRPTSDTVYMVASISKSITATALLQLYEQGKFDLDDDVSDYLGYTLKNPHYPNTTITFRMLLAHQSSIRGALDIMGHLGMLMDALVLNIGSYALLKEYLLPNGSFYNPRVWTDKPPGEEYHYSNIGFMLLGSLVERLSNQSFEKYCQENILKPLNMMNSSFNLSHFEKKQLAVPYIHIPIRFLGVYMPLRERELKSPSAGGLRTSVEDLSHFLIAQMNGGVYNGVRILSESTVKLMHTIQYLNSTYGLGWMILDNGRQGHGGQSFGCDSNMWVRKSDNVGVIFFINRLVDTDIKSIYLAYKHIAEELFLKANEF